MEIFFFLSSKNMSLF
uniref:Uncharacterized protein n=1 Tax=Anguilla anguilla TaxID=7936 RepID=A0A0E9QZB8_ANGAN